MAFKLLLDAILSKKELQSVDSQFALHELKAFFARDAKALKYFNSGKISERSSEFKRIVKAVRLVLRRAHSLFEVGNRTEEYLRFHEELNNCRTWKQFEVISRKVLESHASSSERLDDYKKLYSWLLKKVKPLKRVIDLGCGLHPFSLVYLGKKTLDNVEYLAFDINKSEQDLLNTFFSSVSNFSENFSGSSSILNLRVSKDIAWLKKIREADLAFMLKLTDHLDRGKGHTRTEVVLKAVPSRFVLLSFPTVTRSGKPMRYPQRRWVEYLCERLEYSVEKFETSTELFYLVKKE